MSYLIFWRFWVLSINNEAVKGMKEKYNWRNFSYEFGELMMHCDAIFFIFCLNILDINNFYLRYACKVLSYGIDSYSQLGIAFLIFNAAFNKAVEFLHLHGEHAWRSFYIIPWKERDLLHVSCRHGHHKIFRIQR